METPLFSFNSSLQFIRDKNINDSSRLPKERIISEFALQGGDHIHATLQAHHPFFLKTLNLFLYISLFDHPISRTVSQARPILKLHIEANLFHDALMIAETGNYVPKMSVKEMIQDHIS